MLDQVQHGDGRGGKAKVGAGQKAKDGKRACTRVCVSKGQRRQWWCCGDIGGRLTRSGGRGSRGMAWQGTFLRVRCGWQQVAVRVERQKKAGVKRGEEKRKGWWLKRGSPK